MSKNCKICSLVLMQPHKELMFWFKCSTCGYTEFDLNLIHPSRHEQALRSKYARYDALEPVPIRTSDPLVDQEDKNTKHDSGKD